MILSRKIELKPNNRQRTLFRQHCGTARFAFNWGLSVCIEANDQRKKERAETGTATTKFPTAIDLHKRLVMEVKPLKPWIYESSKCAPQQSLRDLEAAFKRMFKVPGTGFPRFKKKSGKASFYLESPNAPMAVDGCKVKLPKIGWMRCKEAVPSSCQFKSVVISERTGRWFMAFKIIVPNAKPTTATDIMGVDLGVKAFATLSNGKQIFMPKQVKLQQKLVRLQRQLSRREKGSGRHQRTKQRMAVIHYRIANVRKDVTHKLTNDLAKNHGVIVVEDLCVSGMMKRHSLAASIAAANLSEAKRQLLYKCERYGSQLVVADRWFPSSQICSSCGQRQKMPLHVRQYDCLMCGLSLNRDLNAAKNLAASYAVTVRQNPEVTAGQPAVPGPLREESRIAPCEQFVGIL